MTSSPPVAFAHVARRLLSGRPAAEYLDATPEGAMRRCLDRLGSLRLDERQAALDAFLDARDDGPAIREAIAEVDPDAPPPAEEADPDDGWGTPRLDRPPEAEAFPLDVLPPSARAVVQEAARSVGCPIDFPAVAALAVAAGVIGRSASLKLKDHYFASPALWVAAVGPPSDGKSPGVDLILQATARIDDALQAEHDQAMEIWRDKPPDEGGKRPAPPRPRRVDIDDCTTEALVGVLADNKRGLLQFKDELAGFLHGMDQYRAGGKGSDRPKYLSIWSGKRIKIDRKMHEANIPVRVQHPCLTLFGPLVPDSLAALSGPQGGSDGFLDRFLFAYPEQLPVPDWSEDGVDDATVAAWEDLVLRLWDRPLAEGEGGLHPHVVHLNGDARDAWRRCHKAHVAEMNDPDFPAHFRGPWGKLREYAGRFALVLALMGHADDPEADPARVPDVTARVVEDAWELVAYFASHARKAHARIAGGRLARDSPERRTVVAWLRAHPCASFTVSALTQARKSLRNNPDLDAALEGLVRDRVIRPHPEKRRSPAYEVHPSLRGDCSS